MPRWLAWNSSLAAVVVLVAWRGIRRLQSRRRPALEIHARHRPIERGLMPRWRVD